MTRISCPFYLDALQCSFELALCCHVSWRFGQTTDTVVQNYLSTAANDNTVRTQGSVRYQSCRMSLVMWQTLGRKRALENVHHLMRLKKKLKERIWQNHPHKSLIMGMILPPQYLLGFCPFGCINNDRWADQKYREDTSVYDWDLLWVGEGVGGDIMWWFELSTPLPEAVIVISCLWLALIPDWVNSSWLSTHMSIAFTSSFKALLLVLISFYFWCVTFRIIHWQKYNYALISIEVHDNKNYCVFMTLDPPSLPPHPSIMLQFHKTSVVQKNLELEF